MHMCVLYVASVPRNVLKLAIYVAYNYVYVWGAHLQA